MSWLPKLSVPRRIKVALAVPKNPTDTTAASNVRIMNFAAVILSPLFFRLSEGWAGYKNPLPGALYPKIPPLYIVLWYR